MGDPDVTPEGKLVPSGRRLLGLPSHTLYRRSARHQILSFFIQFGDETKSVRSDRVWRPCLAWGITHLLSVTIGITAQQKNIVRDPDGAGWGGAWD